MQRSEMKEQFTDYVISSIKSISRGIHHSNSFIADTVDVGRNLLGVIDFGAVQVYLSEFQSQKISRYQDRFRSQGSYIGI